MIPYKLAFNPVPRERHWPCKLKQFLRASGFFIIVDFSLLNYFNHNFYYLTSVSVSITFSR